MSNIEFKNPYGYHYGSPVWIVWWSEVFRDQVRIPFDFKGTHENRVDAEGEAAKIARSLPGVSIYVMAAVTELRTGDTVIGEKFDPGHRRRPEFDEVEPFPPEHPPSINRTQEQDHDDGNAADQAGTTSSAEPGNQAEI